MTANTYAGKFDMYKQIMKVSRKQEGWSRGYFFYFLYIPQYYFNFYNN